MAYFSPQFSSSPVLTMSPQPPHQTPLGMASFTNRHASPRSFGSSPNQRAFFQSARPAVTGRKRSRDEASVNLEPDVSALPVEEPETEWVYGPGMTLVKSKTQYISDAGTQSGTWLEERKAAEESTRKELLALSRNHKSQRTDTSSNAQPSALTTAAASPLKVNAASSPTEGRQAPVVDDFTLHLGIGWRRISGDEHIQAAARGWARFIENHFAVSNARVVLESNGLQSYLVEASEGFFLFAENLRQGQLVSHTVEGALANLQCSPPKFDGAETLSAAESPKPVDMRLNTVLADTEMRMD
ncbi:hypothetical protein B0J13DRAFT_91572 [Dactylonectria estremocensis]|uniref:Uncharacterized protein n=1 Tax=Dactylonectria estremocensis TaxID=1079267 RepID=A0A9P9IWG4_9HYPO|nr:hypothetical protein B0J13DRAFT_91572 [Dactylonectria estremocensis]